MYSELEALVLLSRTPGLRMRTLAPFWEQGLRPVEILERIRLGEKPEWRESLESTERVFHPAREIEEAEKRKIQIIPFGSPEYPALLKESCDPPLVLYIKGTLLELDQAAVAVVGSRHPSLYGLEQAKRFSSKLAAWGMTIVSGFARGVDRASHEGALEVAQGRTIAVLGSGLDVIYPKEHRNLYEEISERGALISEFALGTAPLAENFPKRNRIIAGLSLGVLVIEAHFRSGSLITAHLAADEGREVFALPGRVDQLGSRGTHRLIREGALLVESPEEILDALGPFLSPLVLLPEGDRVNSAGLEEPLDEEEEQFFHLLQKSSFTPDELAERKSQPISRVRALLTRLELKGSIRKRLDGRYERGRVGSPV